MLGSITFQQNSRREEYRMPSYQATFLVMTFCSPRRMVDNRHSFRVKSCHPDRANTFELGGVDFQKWTSSSDNEFIIFVWLGSPRKNETPVYWVARKKEAGLRFAGMRAKSPKAGRWRVAPDGESGLNPKWKYPTRLDKAWRDNWVLLDPYTEVT